MPNPVFKIECPIPRVAAELPRFRYRQGHQSPAQVVEWKNQLNARIKAITALFKMPAKPQDLGSMMLYKHENNLLRLYTTSDSICWNNLNAIDESDPAILTFPLNNRDKLRKDADNLLNNPNFKSDYATFASLEYDTITTLSPNKSPEELTVSANVGYTFSMADKPVFGPGAKIQVRYSGNYELAEFLYFWRHPLPNGKHKIITPAMALEALQADARFAELKPDKASVKVTEFQLGYYAFPPFVAQAHSLPVYQFRGVIDTETHKNYNFVLHLVALNMPRADLIKQGFLPDSEFPELF